MSYKSILSISILLILEVLIIYLSYKTSHFYYLNENIKKEYNKTAMCKFSAVNYTVNDKRLAIISQTNLSSNTVTLYYPLNYLETYFLHSYNTSIYRIFFQSLNNKTFKCKVNDKLHQSYFNDYSVFNNIKKLVSTRDVFLLFTYMLIISGSLFISIIVIIFIYNIKKKKKYYNYNTIEYYN
jgi:hypothetical protein